MNFQMFKLALEKAEEPEIKLPTSAAGSSEKQDSSRKTSISALLTMPKPLTPTPVFLPGESQGQGSLAGCSPWGCKELDTSKGLTFTFTFHGLLGLSFDYLSF